jgi:hypothetical protein
MGYQGFAADYKEEQRYQDYPSGGVSSTEQKTRKEGQCPEHQAVAYRIYQVTFLEPNVACGVGG